MYVDTVEQNRTFENHVQFTSWISVRASAPQDPPEHDDQVNSKELYLFRNDSTQNADHKGWYIAQDLGCADVDAQGTYAWGKSRSGEPQTFPLQMHIPYYRKKPSNNIRIVAYTTFLEEKVAALTDVAKGAAEVCMAHGNNDADRITEIVQAFAGDHLVAPHIM